MADWQAVAPRPGFQWSLVMWGGPDQPRTERCSYCGDPFPGFDGSFVPLILSRRDGRVAEFCDHCQAAWFGIETFPDPPDDNENEDEAPPADDAELPDLGPCCMCGGGRDVRNIVTLDRRCAVPGRGWGCLVCSLPADGAYAVLCDPCLARWQQDESLLTECCRGYPATDGRIAIAELLLEPFAHDWTKHAAAAPRRS